MWYGFLQKQWMPQLPISKGTCWWCFGIGGTLSDKCRTWNPPSFLQSFGKVLSPRDQSAFQKTHSCVNIIKKTWKAFYKDICIQSAFVVFFCIVFLPLHFFCMFICFCLHCAFALAFFLHFSFTFFLHDMLHFFSKLQFSRISPQGTNTILPNIMDTWVPGWNCPWPWPLRSTRTMLCCGATRCVDPGNAWSCPRSGKFKSPQAGEILAKQSFYLLYIPLYWI